MWSAFTGYHAINRTAHLSDWRHLGLDMYENDFKADLRRLGSCVRRFGRVQMVWYEEGRIHWVKNGAGNARSCIEMIHKTTHYSVVFFLGIRWFVMYHTQPFMVRAFSCSGFLFGPQNTLWIDPDVKTNNYQKRLVPRLLRQILTFRPVGLTSKGNSVLFFPILIPNKRS